MFIFVERISVSYLIHFIYRFIYSSVIEALRHLWHVISFAFWLPIYSGNNSSHCS